MRENPFKVGDLVRLKNDRSNDDKALRAHGITRGRSFVVAKVRPDYVDLMVDAGRVSDGWFWQRFELVEAIEDVEEAPDFIIVMIDDDGAYAPAETPRVFRSEKAAVKVSEKMAADYGGEFVVFKAVHTAGA